MISVLTVRCVYSVLMNVFCIFVEIGGLEVRKYYAYLTFEEVEM